VISFVVYRLIHFVGLVLVLVALGGASIHSASGGTKATLRGRRLVLISHGLGLFLLLLGGFGMLARMGIGHEGLPGWIWGKLLVWLAFGGITALSYRRPEWSLGLFAAVPVLATLAAWMAIFKPF
jgi:hypothetical protein